MIYFSGYGKGEKSMSDERTIKPNAPADFTPQLGDYKTLQPFRYWCQKVLPLVYDDSLSYYELLCKVVDYLNKTMEDVETLHGDVNNLHDAYVELQNYVNKYFDSLDVQHEIDNKLNEMSSDGTLSTLIIPYVQIAPVFVDSISEMTDTKKIYVLKSDGHLYYYDTSWKDSGIAYGINGLYPKYIDFNTWSNNFLEKQPLGASAIRNPGIVNYISYPNGTFSAYTNATGVENVIAIQYFLLTPLECSDLLDYSFYLETETDKNITVSLAEVDLSGSTPLYRTSVRGSGIYTFTSYIVSKKFTAKNVFIRIADGTIEDYNKTKITIIKNMSAIDALIKKYTNTIYPNNIDFNTWSNNFLEKQPLGASAIRNPGIVNYISYPNGTFSAYTNATGVENVIAIQYFLLTPLECSDLLDYSFYLETETDKNITVSLAEVDLSGSTPLYRTSVRGSGIYTFTSYIVSKKFTAKNVFIRIADGTIEDYNKTKITIIKNLGAIDTLIDKKITEKKTTLVCIGDSLTQGSGGNGITFGGIISSHFNWDYKNFGVGGESPSTIAYRCKCNIIRIPANTNPTNYFTPESYISPAMPYPIPPFENGRKFPITVNGVKYTATRNGSKIKIDDISSATYPRNIVFDIDSVGDVYTIWIGTNSDRTFDAISPYIDMIVSNINSNKYVIIGLTIDGTESIANLNNQLKDKYKEHFLDIKNLLINYGLNIVGLTPTPDDTERINTGNVPSSLLSADKIHFNSNGYKAIGLFVIDHMYALGYDK